MNGVHASGSYATGTAGSSTNRIARRLRSVASCGGGMGDGTLASPRARPEDVAW